MKKVFVIMLCFMLVSVPFSFSADPVCGKEVPENYVSAATGQLVRGIYNASFGWLELFRRPIEAKDKRMGVADGVAYFVGRTLLGVTEVATFFAPRLPIPKLDYVCPFQDFQTKPENRAA